ncbi:hypothetical protein SAMN04489844_0932 [Nocardioides exalbidus]|uniref:Uncharacterized protein n=1 Tax=Nocardioides exalbidus TaxID=402596 RepID=A0A1H4LQP0_9ACTN|nr:hypothetical protein [Nocardioides exalbidus]SEB72592.1 hypothetical protein SAMN04489844_0932 [Nocardioides exalbidus]
MKRLLDRSRLLVVAVLGITVSLPAALGVGLTTGVATAAPGGNKPAYEQTRHLDRSIVVGGQSLAIDSRDMTVTVDRTTQLRGRERVNISWTGAHPTGGRASSPFGEQGLLQEYPVVILQCRGLDDPSLPLDKQLSPETCWTSSRAQRSQVVDETEAVWRHDAFATDAARGQKYGLDPIPAECNDVANFSTHITPFRAANGTVYASCTSETMPPEAAIGAAFPPAEQAAYSDLEGNGHTKFEVRSDIENESLGCNDKVACSIVVIPIQGISCLDEDPACSRGGQFEPGSSNFANQGVDLTASPTLWWAASNWRNRFSIPITFGLPPDACTVLDDRAPTGFYGSELMSQASLQWSPSFCLNKKRFKFQHNKMADAAGFTLAENGGGAAAFVSGEHAVKGTDPMAYAPTAVTGFSIGYVIDRPGNSGEFTGLKLNARLIAKLMTQSYLGSELGRAHPGMSTNPVSLNVDPEFQKLNPGLDTITREAAATLLSLSESSDVIESLTSYIAQDKDAAAFVAGKADPWGMKVNPSYKKIKLPTPEWPLLDDFVPVTADECRQQNPTPYFTQLAAPVNSIRKIAEAILDAWPNVQTKCERSTITDPWKIGRVDRQGVGTRFMLGVVSMGDAERLGLDQARLQTRNTFVAPSSAGISRALRLAKPSKSGEEPFTLEMADMVKANAYPGTMIVYTAARTANLPQEDADKVEQFIEVATTEGQKEGYGNGQLPPGYYPLKKTGITAPLWKQAQSVAAAIGEQKGATDSDGSTGGSGGGAGGSGGAGGGGGTTDPGPGSVTEVGGSGTEESPTDEGGTGQNGKGGEGDQGKGDTTDDEADEPELVAMPPTTEVSSPVAERALPLLLLVALVSAIAANLIRLRHLRRRRS